MIKRAGFWIRGAAVALDIVIGVFPALVISTAIAFLLRQPDTPPAMVERASEGIFSSLVLAYSFLEVVFAGTPGKKILGLIIADADRSPSGRWRLLLRWSTKTYSQQVGLIGIVLMNPAPSYLAGLMNVILGIGCLAALNPDKRAWHDEWAGTAVFWKSRARALPPPLPTQTVGG
jgi:uncharacterized RDD family membrane protein YckC